MEEDKFKKFMQNIGLDEPGSSLTDNVMKIIESQEEMSLNRTLLSAIKNELVAEPSAEFSDKLMARIAGKPYKISSPIIKKKIGLIMGGSVIAILLLVVVISNSGAS